jgi:hypothetical protein
MRMKPRYGLEAFERYKMRDSDWAAQIKVVDWYISEEHYMKKNVNFLFLIKVFILAMVKIFLNVILLSLKKCLFLQWFRFFQS